jgi:hypothetical protein
MTLIKNELTGSRVFVVLGGKKEKIHLKGGHAKPQKDTLMCGKELGRQKKFAKYPLHLTPVSEKSEWRIFERD